jgi:hypothetical protein
VSTLVGMPRGVLLALSACVLIAHLWVLSGAATHLRLRAPAPVPTFTTRRIELPVIAQTPPAPPATQAPVRAPATSPPRSQHAVAPLPLAAAPARSRIHAEEPAASAAVPVEPAQAQVARFNVPEPATLHYEVTARVKGQQVQGTSELAWHHDGERYEAVFELAVPALPPRRQHSAGQLAGGGFAPQRYAERSRGEQATHFEREEQRFIFSNNRPAAPLAAGAQDRLSVLLQLSALFAGEPQRYPPGTTIAIQTATTRDAGTWLFTVEAQETLQLPGGDMTTVKLVRPPRGDYDLRMELWLAPGAAYVPVRLRLTQPNGDWIDHQWSTTDRR